MLHSVPVLNHSVRSAARRTLARRSPLAVTIGSRNLAGSSGRQVGDGVDAVPVGANPVVTLSSMPNTLSRREGQILIKHRPSPGPMLSPSQRRDGWKMARRARSKRGSLAEPRALGFARDGPEAIPPRDISAHASSAHQG